ncbi:hypothetical protein CU669_06005 [Paramagnetospirillum kuznetsovii]|uniref:Uncharacterized protein n=1 Tax=Paramagnetospirillum kuznetsovii TaxID=2053833 RepID=A0A364P0V3_9PROT|nr:hypothetical protein CU669_06005 [Paramagnetospirillum kuznetsovii]
MEGPVIDVFRREIPELKHRPRPAAYDTVMNDPKMLDRCFRLFRSRPELFRDVVVDQGRQPVTLDKAVLSCGRTLAEAVALVVRASARRYFRAKLDFRSRFQVPTAKPSLGKRLVLALGLTSAPVVKKAPRSTSKSEALYLALRDYLQFDWQVLLIPHYAPMTPALVSDLGARLLDIREAAELQALAAPGATPRDGRKPLLLDGAQRLMMPGRDCLDAEVLWRVVQQMDLARLFPKAEVGQVQRSVARISAMHGDAIKVLLPVLGDDIRRFTAFVMIAFTTMGEQRFKQDFCQSGQVHAVTKLAERLARVEAPPASLELMKQVYGAVLETAYAGGVEVGAVLQARPHLKQALDSLGGSPMSISG